MSEFSGLDPNTISNAANLPSDFLGINPTALEASANTDRSMAHLLHGRDSINSNSALAAVVVNGSRYESPDVARHVTRGAALTQILLADSMPSFALDIADLADPDPQPNPRREALGAAAGELVAARQRAVLSETWRVTPEEAAQNEAELRNRVDEVLGKAGLSGHLEAAIQRLTGPGLEEPTRELDAKYGAALVALGTGLIRG